MSRPSQRFTRILRVRAAEHRIAAARQIAAERRIGELLGVARRIGILRSSLRPGMGLADGQSLHAMSEMHERLGRAERDLAQPISMAENDHARASAVRLAASAREDGAERLRERAAAGEGYTSTLREDANRPAPLTKRRRG